MTLVDARIWQYTVTTIGDRVCCGDISRWRGLQWRAVSSVQEFTDRAVQARSARLKGTAEQTPGR